MEKHLTIGQAFDVMVCFLDGYYQRTKSDDVASLLGDLSLDIWTDDITGDPAAWNDWMACAQRYLFPMNQENQALVAQLIADPRNHAGTDQAGSEWFAQILPSGSQVWAKVRGGKVLYAGVRSQPRSFDPVHGFSSPKNP